MLRRLLSHLLITLAVFSLVATFYIWFIDGVVLNPNKLVPTLKDAGVTAEIAKLLPEMVTKDAKPEEKSEMTAKISKVVTADYISDKMQAISTSLATFMRNGTPQPVIDISDFPSKLRASGVDVGTDIDDSFAKPIELNKDGKLDKLPQAYSKFKLLKIAGLALFAFLLLLEWFVAAKGDKLHRVGRIFLHTSIWFFVFYGAVVFLPGKAVSQLKADPKTDASMLGLIDAVAKAVQHLFADYFLSFAVACGVIALVLYLLRHGKKHIKTIKEVPATSPAKQSYKIQPTVKK